MTPSILAHARTAIRRRRRGAPLSALAASLLLAAGCGGEGTLPGAGVGGAGTGLMSGTSTYGTTRGAMLQAYAVADGLPGALLGSATTDATGNFAVEIGGYAGPVLLQVSGGTYVDEATGVEMTMLPGDVMAAAVPSVAAGSTTSGIQITPLTTMAQARARNMAGGLTDANVAAANGAMASHFAVGDVLRTVPMDPRTAGAGSGASQEARDYGMAIAAMSQLALSVGMPNSSAIVTALAQDASDGVLDGKLGATPITMGGGMTGASTLPPSAGTEGLATALGQFLASSANRCGLGPSDLQALEGQLSAAADATTTTTATATGASDATPGAIGGTLVYGPMSGATMTAFGLQDGAMGPPLGSATTDAQGHFTISIGGYAGPVMIQAMGGTFVDDATGATMTVQPGDVMAALLPSVTAGSSTTGIQVTPLTSMAQARARTLAGGMTDANIEAANAAVASYFSAGDVLRTAPMDPRAAGAGAAAGQASRNYGMTIAAMSEYARSLGMTTSSEAVVTAMMDDATDGVMDGRMGSTTIAMGGVGTGMTGAAGGAMTAGGGMIAGGAMMASTAGTSGLAAAMTAFLGDPTANLSGVTAADMQALLAQLSSSSGAL